MVFKVFFCYLVSALCFFLPLFTLASLSPGVMLLNHSTAPRDCATDIEKTYRKGVPERKRPNRSVVKNREHVEQLVLNDQCISYVTWL